MKKQKLLLILARTILDTVVFFGIGYGAYMLLAMVFGLIALSMYKPWFDAEFEDYADRLRISRVAKARRIFYGFYYGSAWPSANLLWAYDHLFNGSSEENKS